MKQQLQPRQEKAENWRKKVKRGPERAYNSRCVAYTQRKVANNKISVRNRFRERPRQSQFSLLKPGICTADFQNGDPVFLRAAEGLTDAFLGTGRRGIPLQAGPVFVWT
jgi:hypothetical protein